MSSGRREHGFQPLAGVGRAADDLQGLAGAGRDLTNLQPVGVGMPARFDDLGDDEILQRGGGIVDGLDLEPNAGECLYNFLEWGVGFEVILEPREGELHFA